MHHHEQYEQCKDQEDGEDDDSNGQAGVAVRQKASSRRMIWIGERMDGWAVQTDRSAGAMDRRVDGDNGMRPLIQGLCAEAIAT